MNTNTNLNEVKQKLIECGFVIAKETRLANNYGTRLDLTNRSIVNVFDTGKVSYQGRNTEQVEACLAGSTTTDLNVAPTSPDSSIPTNNEIFVVYGHDPLAKAQLDALLRKWELKPLFLDRLPSEGQTIIEKLERYRDQVQYAVVLATPDDKGYRKNSPDEITHRARQNVVLELGMMLSKLGRKRVAILLKDPDSMERPSDIGDLIYIPFDDDIEQDAGSKLAQELGKAGYPIPPVSEW